MESVVLLSQRGFSLFKRECDKLPVIQYHIKYNTHTTKSYMQAHEDNLYNLLGGEGLTQCSKFT